MRRLRVIDGDQVLVECSVEDPAEIDAWAQEADRSGFGVIVDDGAAAPGGGATAGTPAGPAAAVPLAPEDVARRVVSQTLVDFHGCVQQLMGLYLDTTRQWLALGARIIDEDVRRRGLVHSALTDLDIADRSIGVLELQGRMARTREWGPDPKAQDSSAGIVQDLVGALGKQLLEKKN